MAVFTIFTTLRTFFTNSCNANMLMLLGTKLQKWWIYKKKKKIRIRDPEKAVLIISYPSNTVIHTFCSYMINTNYFQSMYRLIRRHKWKKDIVKTVYQQPERGFCFDEPSTFFPPSLKHVCFWRWQNSVMSDD